MDSLKLVSDLYGLPSMAGIIFTVAGTVRAFPIPNTHDYI